MLGKAGLLLALGMLTHHLWLDSRKQPSTVSARSSQADQPGEYGGNLNFLRRYWVAPQTEGESNHYLDLWNPGTLAALARVNGLTNNHALFVDSHGKAWAPKRSLRSYAIYPHQSLVAPHEKTPHFSPGDLAELLGPEQAAQIHNIVLAGCNEEGQLRPQEFRRHFVNATNITYMTPGELAFKPMFYQAIVLPSSEIKPLYGRVRRTTSGRVESETSATPARGTKPLGTYIADLYVPGAAGPFATRKAGRELLDTPRSAAAMLRADASTFSVEP